jgi:flagellar basal body-associated protein FliL
MVELQLVTQVLVIVVLLLLSVVLGYVVFMLNKLNKKLDTLLEILTYYEKLKVIAVDLVKGPGKMYFDIAQSAFSFILPLLTNRQKSK